MALSKVTPKDIILGYLRKNLTDHKARTGEWIFPDRPNEDEVNFSDNFPMISVEQMSLTTTSMTAMDDAATDDEVNLLVNVWTKRREIITVGTWEETITWIVGTTIYPLTNQPFSIIEEVINETTGAPIPTNQYSAVDEDGDGFYESIAFQSSILDGTQIKVKYSRVAEGLELAEFIAQEVHETIRDGWRTSDVFTGKLWDYERLSQAPPPFETDSRLFRCELQLKLQGVNIGD